jgi:uncharacterized protein (TIGR02466 family)
MSTSDNVAWHNNARIDRRAAGTDYSIISTPVRAMELPELNIHKLFATPVIISHLPDVQDLNRELLEHTLARAASEPGRQHSNQNGWQSPDDFATLELPAARRLCAIVTQVVNAATAVNTPNGLIEAAFEWRTNAWANVNPPGASNAMHGHPGAFWSAVYYVDDGGANADEGGSGGELILQDPRGVLPAMHDPLLRFRVEGCLTAGYVEAVNPKPGMLILFPSWILHGVEPFSGTRPRVSVAFNFGSP